MSASLRFICRLLIHSVYRRRIIERTPVPVVPLALKELQLQVEQKCGDWK